MEARCYLSRDLLQQKLKQDNKNENQRFSMRLKTNGKRHRKENWTTSNDGTKH